MASVDGDAGTEFGPARFVFESNPFCPPHRFSAKTRFALVFEEANPCALPLLGCRMLRVILIGFRRNQHRRQRRWCGEGNRGGTCRDLQKVAPDRYDVEEKLDLDLPIAVYRNSLLAANQFSTVLLHNKRF
jgi:hypothetical protein